MSADSPRKAYKYTCNMVRPLAYSEKSLMESVVDFFNDVVPQAYTGSPRIDDKEKIQWVRFEDCDISDIAKNPDLFKSDTKGLPLLLILGYSNGVQIWYITPNGEAQEIMSIRQGPVRLFRVLPTPDTVLGFNDTYSLKRPLAVMCDSSSAGQPYCSVKFISLKTGDEIHSINYKTLTVQNVECNKRFLVTVFHEKVCVYEACQFKQLFWITSCHPCPGPTVNPIALSTRWLAYADKRLVPMHQSCGGMSGDGSQSYAATVISAAKGCFKGLSMFGETVGNYVTGNKTSFTTKKVDMGVVDNGDRPGIVSVLDLQNIHGEHFNVNEDNEGDGLIAHFHAHANEPVANMAFDSSGTLLVTACKLGHNFHIFRLMAHPCNSSLGAVHHLYTLHRGDTTAKVIDIGFNHDSRWVTVSTHRGTTHLFPITPYGGSVNVRTHCQPHVVNRASRFHKSAGLDEIEHHSSVDRRSPVLSSSPGSSGQYDRYPSLIQQNTLNNNMGNPRLPPYPHPITVYPSYQIKQPLNISMNPGNKNASPTHSPTGIDNIFSVAAKFSTPRMCVVGSPKLGKERRDSGKRPVDSLFILAQSGTLVEYVLEPRGRLSTEKVTDESQLELGVTGRIQWNLQRLKNSPEQRPPLPSNSPLILAREAVVTQIPTAPDLFDLPGLTRHESKESLSSDHSGKDDSDEQWLSQVEIITHAGPHRRLWMGPQFSFKTYQNTTVLSSNSSALLSQSAEVNLAAMDIAGDEGDLESLKVQPARSNPVSMPTARPAYRRLSGSDSSPTPSKGAHSAPLMIEAGSYDQSPHLCDVYSNWTESTVAKQPHLSDDLEEDQLKETLADAMVESPVKDAGKCMIKQEIIRSETSQKEILKGTAENLEERHDKKKQKGKKKRQSQDKNDRFKENEGIKSSEAEKAISQESTRMKQLSDHKDTVKSKKESQNIGASEVFSSESKDNQRKKSESKNKVDEKTENVEHKNRTASKKESQNDDKSEKNSTQQSKSVMKTVSGSDLKSSRSKDQQRKSVESDVVAGQKKENEEHKVSVESKKESENISDSEKNSHKQSKGAQTAVSASDLKSSKSKSNQRKTLEFDEVADDKTEKVKSKVGKNKTIQENLVASDVKVNETQMEEFTTKVKKKKNKAGNKSPAENEQKQHSISASVAAENIKQETDCQILDKDNNQASLKNAKAKDDKQAQCALIEDKQTIGTVEECTFGRNINADTALQSSDTEDATVKIKSETETFDETEEGAETITGLMTDVAVSEGLSHNRSFRAGDAKKKFTEEVNKSLSDESNSKLETSQNEGLSVSQSKIKNKDEDQNATTVITQEPKGLFETIRSQKKAISDSKDNSLVSQTVTDTVGSISTEAASILPLSSETDTIIADQDNSVWSLKSVTENKSRTSVKQTPSNLSSTNVSNFSWSKIAQAGLQIKDEKTDKTVSVETASVESKHSRDQELPSESTCSESVMDKKKISEIVSEMEDSKIVSAIDDSKVISGMEESMMEMSVTDLPSKTSSDDIVAQGGKDDGFQASGKNRKKRKKNKKTSGNDLFGGSNDNISISSGSSAGMVMNRQAEQLLDNVFSMAGESTDSN